MFLKVALIVVFCQERLTALVCVGVVGAMLCFVGCFGFLSVLCCRC